MNMGKKRAEAALTLLAPARLLLWPILSCAARLARAPLERLQACREVSGRVGRFVGVGELVGVGGGLQVVQFPEASAVLDVFHLIAREDAVEILACPTLEARLQQDGAPPSGSGGAAVEDGTQ